MCIDTLTSSSKKHTNLVTSSNSCARTVLVGSVELNCHLLQSKILLLAYKLDFAFSISKSNYVGKDFKPDITCMF